VPIKRRFPVGLVAAHVKGPACSVSSRLSSLIQIPEFSERPMIVPHEVLSGLNGVRRALSPNKLYFFIFSESKGVSPGN